VCLEQKRRPACVIPSRNFVPAAKAQKTLPAIIAGSAEPSSFPSTSSSSCVAGPGSDSHRVDGFDFEFVPGTGFAISFFSVILAFCHVTCSSLNLRVVWYRPDSSRSSWLILRTAKTTVGQDSGISRIFRMFSSNRRRWSQSTSS